jgi:HSP20 family protein
MLRKPSFFERLTGIVRIDEYEDDMLDVEGESEPRAAWDEQPAEQPIEEGELPIDMYRTADSIVIRALVAGVHPEDLEVAITRDMVTIRGTREEDQEAPDEDYHFRELFWGSFSRTIVLPEEIIIDEAEAKEKHGLLTIVLPKVDKDRSTKLKVRAH